MNRWSKSIAATRTVLVRGTFYSTESSRPSIASFLLVPEERIKKLQELRIEILGRLASKEKVLSSRVNQLINYYPPDINIFKLANQDASLGSLRLVDVREEQIKRKERLAAERGKPVRVSIVDGSQPPPEKSGKKKKKK